MSASRNRQRRLGALLVGIVLCCGLLGFALARQFSGGPPQAQLAPMNEAPLRPDSSVTTVTTARVEIPESDFQDAAGFRTYVERLEALGLTKDFSRWLALASLASRDFRASFDFAIEEDLLNLWSSGAAMADPEAAAELIQTLPPAKASRAAREFFTILGRTNPEAGLRLMLSLPIAVITAGDAAFPFFASWAQNAPIAAAEAALTIESATLRDRALGGAFHNWGPRDRTAMMAWAAAQNPQVGRTAFFSMYEGTVMTDPAEVFALAAKYPDLVHNAVIFDLAGSLATMGDEGWQIANALPAGAMRNEILQRYGGALAQSDPARAWELAKTMEPRDRRYFLQLAASGLAKADPAGVAELAAKGELGPSYQFRSVMQTWSETDPAAAFAWAHRQPGSRSRLDALTTIVRQWSESDPMSAVSALDQLTPEARARVLPNLAAGYGKVSPPSALAWAKNLRPIERSRAMESIFEGWADVDPSAAAAELLTVPADGLDSAITSVASGLANKDPGAALKWSGQLGPTNAQNSAARAAANVWGRNDAETASDYLTELPTGDFRDYAVRGFTASITTLDPGTAAAWAKSIGRKELRTEALTDVLRVWKAKDPAAARNFAEALEPGPTRDQMLKITAP